MTPQPTNEFRQVPIYDGTETGVTDGIHRPTYLKNVTGYFLQQKWLMTGDAGDSGFVVPVFEWRDVPIVEDDAKK